MSGELPPAPFRTGRPGKSYPLHSARGRRKARTRSRARPRAVADNRRVFLVGSICSIATLAIVAVTVQWARSATSKHATAATATTVQAATSANSPSNGDISTAIPGPSGLTATAPIPGGSSPIRNAASTYSYSTSFVTLTDPTRPTPARGDVPGHAGRSLRTLIVRPVGAPSPTPLVVFGHGFDTEPEAYLPLLDAWAAAGYLVVAPEFPGSAANLPGDPTESDMPQQAFDMSFVISSMLSGTEGPVDPARVAVAGHSDGADTVGILAFNTSFSDARIRAYVSLAGAYPDGIPGNRYPGPTSSPLLAMVGDNDEYENYPTTIDLFDAAAMPKILVTVPGGDHLQIFVGSTRTASDMRNATVNFLQAAMGSSGQAPSSATLAHAVGLPSGDGSYVVSAGSR